MDDSTGSQDSRRSGSRKSGKQPMKFMFIDASTHGVNAKPNKAVRSFVMHQARRQKPWSTRKNTATSPGADVEDVDPDVSPTTGPKRSPSMPHHRADDGSPVNSAPWQELDPYEWNSRVLGSPVSTRNGSITSLSSQPCISPTSSFGHACDNPACAGDGCGQSHHFPRAVARRSGFTSSSLDPFDSLPVQLDPTSSQLIRHFVDAISPYMVPVDVHRLSTKTTMDWVLKSLHSTTSPPFVNALLTSTALRVWKQMGTGRHSVLYYKAKAIQEINQLFADPTTSVDDNNIAAVFVLLCLEESQSQLAPGETKYDDAEAIETQRKMHYNGLELMVQKRGGLAALSSNRCLQVFMLMHSMAHAIAEMKRPYATLLDATGEAQKYDLPSWRPRPSSTRILRMYKDLKVDPTLLGVVSDSIVLSGDIASWLEKPHHALDPLELQKNAVLLQYRCLDWYKRGEEGESVYTKRNPLDESICLGLIIFLVKSTQPEMPHWRKMVEVPMRKLRASLDSRSLMQWAKSVDLLLWTLTMGALASHRSPNSASTSPTSNRESISPGRFLEPPTYTLTDAEYFADRCRFMFRDQGYTENTDGEELLERMRKCLWVPSLFDRDAKLLWARMGLCREDTYEIEEEEEEEPDRPDLKENGVIGMMTDTRFFPKK